MNTKEIIKRVWRNTFTVKYKKQTILMNSQEVQDYKQELKELNLSK